MRSLLALAAIAFGGVLVAANQQQAPTEAPVVSPQHLAGPDIPDPRDAVLDRLIRLLEDRLKPEPEPNPELPIELDARAERLGFVRVTGEKSKVIQLINCMGDPDTCALTTQSARPGDRWRSAHGPTYIKQADGTWTRSREEPVLAKADTEPEAVEQERNPAAASVAYVAPTRCDRCAAAHVVSVTYGPWRTVQRAGGSWGGMATYSQPVVTYQAQAVGGQSAGFARASYAYQPAWGTVQRAAARPTVYRRAPLRTWRARRQAAATARFACVEG